MKEVIFLDVEALLAIHARMIQEYGGGTGLRDPGLLESAAAMPAASFGGQFLHDGIAAMAAAYLFHLCKNHPFVDGNKRTAFTALDVFLRLNGVRLDAAEDEKYQIVLAVVTGQLSFEAIVEWIGSHTHPV